VFPKQIVFPSLLEGALEYLCAFDEFSANIDVSKVNVIGEAGQDHSFQHLVRIFVNDLFILEGAGLRFVCIADEVNGFTALAINKRPFQAAGKASAATPA